MDDESEAPIKILESYNDFEVIGEYATQDEDGKETGRGLMMGHSVKVRAPDGKVSIKREWITDLAARALGWDGKFPKKD